MRKVSALHKVGERNSVRILGQLFQEQMHALLGTGVFNSDGTLQ